MDLIKLRSVTSHPTQLTIGEAITGYTRAIWVEKYRNPGTFRIEAPLSSGLREFLPEGTFVTHQDTETVMYVENHEIDQKKNEDPTIKISGRCFTAYLEERTLGDYMAFFSTQIVDYVLASDETWDQVVTMIDSHIVNPLDPNDGLIGVEVDHVCTGAVTIEERPMRQGHVHQGVIEVLKVDDLGIKSVRPTNSEPSIIFRVHRGENVSKKVRFSWTRGDLENVKYFFSNKKLKTQVRVMGRWVQMIVNPTGVDNFGRRTGLLDATDIDQHENAYPSGGALFLVESAMAARGRQWLKAQSRVSITQADVSENTTIRFRKDYDIGDLVTVDGDFGSSAVMRVVEYAETEDETGTSGHPTLAIPGEY